MLVNPARNLPREADPWAWSALFAALFLALVWHRLGIPSEIYFDEVHYVPAARKLLALQFANPEHPLLGKELIALSMRLFGDSPIAWRAPSALLGTFGLYAFARLMWFASYSRFATIAGQFLLATGFGWFVQSRIAMLDMPMMALAMAALWQCAAAVRHPAQGGWRLAVAGLCLGLSLAAKWSVAPLAMLPGLVFLIGKLRDCGSRFLIEKAGGPVPGVVLWQAAIWLGLAPLAVYWATFAPAFFYADRPVSPWGVIEQHRYMLQLQDSVRKLHPYRTVWYQWVSNWRGLWYLYRDIDGAWRGVLNIGNPFTVLAGLPALLWCLGSGLWQRHWGKLGMVAAYAALLTLWMVTSKPIQFYYHYLLPSAFLCGALALALDDLWQSRRVWRWLAPAALLAAAGMFIHFYPILSAAPLEGGKATFRQWMWLKSWI